MNKLQHLHQCKHFLRKIIKCRRNLLRMRKGRPENAEMVKTLAEVEYNLGAIDSFDRMMNFLGQRGVRERLKNEIIPKNKKTWAKELDLLVYRGDVLQGRIAKQLELTYN